MRGREDEWTGLMRSAMAGDDAAYHRLLRAVTPVLRAAARRGLARAGQPPDQAEDIVQEILLAVHLKRHTWDNEAPFAPWLFAIGRNKLIDMLRRRGRRIFVNIDDFAETLPGEVPQETASAGEVASQLNTLPQRQRDVVAVDRGRQHLDQGHGGEIFDERGRGAGRAASRPCGADCQTAGPVVMDTDQLIRSLAADNAHRAPRVGAMLTMALLVAAPLSILIFATFLGVRHDVMSAMHNPFFDMKFAVTLSLAIPAIIVSLHLSRPEALLRGWGWLLLLPVGLLAVAIGSEAMMAPAMPMTMRLMGQELQGVSVRNPSDVAAAACGGAVRPAPRRAVASRARRCARRPGVGRARRDAVRLALHRRFPALRRDLVHARDRAGDRDRRAGGGEGSALLARRPQTAGVGPCCMRWKRSTCCAVEPRRAS
ncbi:RNA polymerase sigma factor (sigma-70 family) [Bradyrhizobium sp. LB13.1]